MAILALVVVVSALQSHSIVTRRGAEGRRSPCAGFPLLRVRGGTTITASVLQPGVPEPALLGDAEGSQQDAKAATPDALQVFARTLGYVWRPSFKERALLVVSIALLVLAKSLTLHVPFTEITENMISASQIAKMKKGAFIVNTAR